MHQGCIPVFSTQLGGHDLVGEVVIFVNQKMEFVRRLVYRIHGGLEGYQGIVGFDLDCLRKILAIAADETPYAGIDMVMQRLLDGLGVAIGSHHGEIPAHHKIAIVQGGGGFADLQVSEQPFELVRPGQVVVVFQHRQHQAFSEPARTQEK